jgi:hypothetical protein
MPFIVTTKRPTPPDETGQPYCAACSHYHEGACLCPDCGHPTPCRDHFEGASVQTPSLDVSRQAVATLEEAKDAAMQVVYDGPPIRVKTEWELICMVISDWPESGGTVGPLPDGTTIEVEELTWFVIAKLAECSHDVVKAALFSRDFTPVIDAFNAKQAGQ